MVKPEFPSAYHLPGHRIVLRLCHKVASTSMSQAFLKTCSSKYCRVNPAEVRDLKRLMPDLLVIGFVRHPLDRMVSCYEGRLIDPIDSIIATSLGVEPNCPFETFVEALARTPDLEGDAHYRSQDWHLWGEEGLLTHTFHFESLLDDWAAMQMLFQQRGAELPELEHRNAAKARRPWQGYFEDERILQLAVQRYRRDFERFHYAIPEFNHSD